MRPPVVTSVAPSVFRRRSPALAGRQVQADADVVRACLARREPVAGEVDGYGRGWWVLAVGAGEYEVWRDGTAVRVPWSLLRLDG